MKSILTNEKYKGDALLQKTFTVDFLQKKKKVNEGEVPQYYVENSHPAIVTAEVFDLVQYEMKRRREIGRHTSASGIFSNRLVCGECGAYYGSKVWHSTDAYRTRIWRCNRKYEEKGRPCPSPHLRAEEIQAAFLQAVKEVIERKAEIVDACSKALLALSDAENLEREAERLQTEQERVYQQIMNQIQENAMEAQDQEAYNRRVEPLYARYEALKVKTQKVRDQIMDRVGRRRKMEAYLQRLRQMESVADFDESLFAGTVDQVIVYPGQEKNQKRLTFRWKDGSETPVTI